jgi:hypothetical protein
VVASPRAIGVELALLHTVLDEVAPGRGIPADGSGGRDVVRGHGVAQQSKHTRSDDVAHGCRLAGHLVEVRRSAHVGRVLVPGEHVPDRDVEAPPVVVAGEYIGVAGSEHRRVQVVRDDLLDLRDRRPDVSQVHGRSTVIKT